MISGRREELDQIASGFSTDTEQAAFKKIIDLCQRFEVEASAHNNQVDDDTLTRLWDPLAVLRIDLLGSRDKPDLLDKMRLKLESLRAGSLYQTIRKKILSQTEYVSAADVLYFTAITDEPGLIDLYDVARCVDSLRECSIKSTLALIIDLRARTDKHFNKYRAVRFNESLASCTQPLTRNPLLVTRFMRTHAVWSAVLREESLFEEIKAKVENREELHKVPEIELLYYGLMSSPPDAHFQTYGALEFEHEIIDKKRESHANLRRIVTALLQICSPQAVSQQPTMDAELLKKFHQRGAVVYQNEERFEYFYFLNLENVDLRGLNLIGNDGLAYASLRGANLAYARLDKAMQVDSTRARVHSTKLYNRIDDEQCFGTWRLCCFQQAEFVESTIQELNQMDCSFTGATFDKCKVVLCKNPMKNLSDFNDTTFINSQLENFNYLKDDAARRLTLSNTKLIDSVNVFKFPDAIELSFTFTEVKTLEDELMHFKCRALFPVDREEWYLRDNESLRNNIQMLAARHVIMRVMSDAIPPELRSSLLEAACKHSLFHPQYTAARVVNDVSSYVLPKVFGLFAAAPPQQTNMILSAAQLALENARCPDHASPSRVFK